MFNFIQLLASLLSIIIVIGFATIFNRISKYLLLKKLAFFRRIAGDKGTI